uniref:Uncharacterized protein n=1 Tax=Anguilla anguilla TaxID=7936 RepID=A0A0E9WAX3_ANGAN
MSIYIIAFQQQWKINGSISLAEWSVFCFSSPANV